MKKRQATQKILLSLMIVFFSSAFSSTYAQQSRWDLEDCITYAIENNIQIRQSELGIETSEVDMLQNKLDFLPSLNASTRYSYSWGRILDQSINEYVDRETKQGSLGVDANLTLFNGLQKLNTAKKGKIDFLISQYDADKMKDDISLMLTQAYLSILFNKELLRVAREQVSITQEQIDRTAKMVDAGTLARGSLLEIQAQGAKEEINVINYENSLQLAYLDILQILDLPANTDFEIVIPDLPTEIISNILPLGQVYQNALITQPVIKSAELFVESSYKNVSLAKGYLSPTLSLTGGWSTNYSNNQLIYDPTSPEFGQTMPLGDQFKNNQYRYLGLNLSIPIFNGYQVASNISRAKINASNAEYSYELTKNTLRKQIEQAYTDAQSAYKSFVATKTSLKSFEESFRYTEQKFNVGMSNSVDYNISKSQLTAAESELIRARYDYIFKTKILDFYMGKPLTLTN